jgi:hypothetical protein
MTYDGALKLVRGGNRLTPDSIVLQIVPYSLIRVGFRGIGAEEGKVENDPSLIPRSALPFSLYAPDGHQQ